MTTNENGETVRGFSLLIDAPGLPRLTLPCTGQPYYTGKEAIAVMQGYKDRRPNLTVQAYTLANSIEEILTLEEMKGIYDGF
jgi:hypothetical protein